MSTGDSASPGNYGLWDQRLAFEWVRKNIGYFGGNRKSVTIFGESAGAASVSAHSISPHTYNLFDQGIQASGSILEPWASHSKSYSYTYTKQLAIALGCTQSYTNEMVTCMKSKSLNDYKTAEMKIGGSEINTDLEGFKFGPTHDGIFFNDSFDNLIKNAPPKPILIGLNSLEAGLYLSDFLHNNVASFETPSSTSDYYLPRIKLYQNFTMDHVSKEISDFALKHLHLTEEKKKSLTNSIIQVYFNGDKTNKTQLLKSYTELISDIWMELEAFKEAIVKFKNNWPIWLYEFDHYPANTFAFDTDIKGCFHGIDLPYYFGKTLFYSFSINLYDTVDYQVFSHMTDLCTTFAKYGNPTPGWPKLTTAQPERYLHIKPIMEMKDHFNPRMTNFWLKQCAQWGTCDVI